MKFALSVFFIWFRESLEASILIGSLLLTVSQDSTSPTVQKDKVHIRCGIVGGLLVWLIVGAVAIGIDITRSTSLNGWGEEIFEGVLSIIVAGLITWSGPHLLRTAMGRDALWRVNRNNTPIRTGERITSSVQRFFAGLFTIPAASVDGAEEGLEDRQLSRKAWLKAMVSSDLFWPTFTTLVREGVEGIVFSSALAHKKENLGERTLAGFVGIVAGVIPALVIYGIFYQTGKVSKWDPLTSKFVLTSCVCLIYLMAAGLWSRGIWALQYSEWIRVVGEQAEEAGTGPGSYDIRRVAWHTNGCDPNRECAFFTAILGWQNSATWGSVLGYIFYWLFIIMICPWKYYRVDEQIRRRNNTGNDQGTYPPGNNLPPQTFELPSRGTSSGRGPSQDDHTLSAASDTQPSFESLPGPSSGMEPHQLTDRTARIYHRNR